MDGPSPYRAPDGKDGATAHNRPLFGLIAIAVASVIGSVLAGVWLMSMNYVALGRRGTAWVLRLVIVPVLAFAAISALGYVFNAQGAQRITVVLSYLVLLPAAACLFADWAQGGAIRAQAAAGVPARSLWHAVLVALAFVLFAVMFPLILMLTFTVIGLVESSA
ncbi:hypothetical protein [Lysobacter gummosus]|uniref:Transmembrane protein n=1 Tax=Lysobacter gummosus TaxID=262324 RepID=A0ABY3X9P3_9GAMM|nr:hypothetical protein [Lysobacter gummosus]ALN93856.1 hypothetical protein LG3211_4923 [Lysobacter gummosus]UNP29309.1 hypothetical protein MOV92_23045 [Lysobacter gummosus]